MPSYPTLLPSGEDPSITYSDAAPFQFQKRQQQLEQRKARLAQAMRQQQMAPDPNALKGQMVSGHYVAPSWAQQLAQLAMPAAQQYAIDQQQKGLAKDTAEYDTADRRAAIEHAMSRPQATPEQQGPVDPNNPTELAARPVNPTDMAAWTQQGMAIPSRRDVMAKLMADLEVNAPVRAEARDASAAELLEARTARDAEAERNRIEKGEQAAAERADRDKRERDLARQRSEDLRYTTDQNNETRRQMIASNLDKAERAIKAREDAVKAKEDAKESVKAGDAREVLNLLNDATALIPEATSSGLGSAVDAAAGFFGKSTPSADAAAKMKVIGGLLTSKMPKMSGPQSDRDVELYKEMAGKLGDPKVPVSQKQAAAQTIYEINKRYAHLNTGENANPTPAVAKPTSKAERDALPPGTRYVGPDGKTYIR